MEFLKFIFEVFGDDVIVRYSIATNVEIHDLKPDSSNNIYFIGSEGSSLENVIIGKMFKNLTASWQTIYPSNKMYSFEMYSSNIYFMLISSGVQYIVKLNRGTGVNSNVISNNDAGPL